VRLGHGGEDNINIYLEKTSVNLWTGFKLLTVGPSGEFLRIRP